LSFKRGQFDEFIDVPFNQLNALGSDEIHPGFTK
jgi:hypothetical protein